MAILHSNLKRRTNRQLTQQAVDSMIQWINGKSAIDREFINTRVSSDQDGDLWVHLFKKPILRLAANDGIVAAVSIFTGGVYDDYGNPTDLTRERLNGLLEALGFEGVIPIDVRVWADWEHQMCYLARRTEKIALNEGYCTKVTIKASPDDFTVLDMDIVRITDRENQFIDQSTMAKKPGLYANIHAKRKRIEAQKAAGSKTERMRKPGAKGAPTAAAFKAAAKTAKKK